MSTHNPDPHGATHPEYRANRRWRLVTLPRRRTRRALLKRGMRIIARADRAYLPRIE